MEEAARFDDALEAYTEAGSTEDAQRVARNMATEFEKKGDFDSAAEYYETAGAFQEAGRIRASHPTAELSDGSRLTDAQIFKRSVPALVTVVVKNDSKEGHGSGFFVAKGGYVLTNHHVVEAMRDITIVMSNGSRHAAHVVDSTAVPDLALLKADVVDHKILPIGRGAKVEPGPHVATVGFPVLGDLSAIMNAGVISSVDRVVRGNKVYQIDASINYGNSGGPLLDDNGQVIGIVIFGFGDFGVDRFNFAIRIEEARRLLDRVHR